MKTLNWHQVHNWRLAQHGLFPRLNSRNIVEAVTLTGGIQAQVMSAAELAVCTRVEGLYAEDVRSAVWQERTLIKTWAMRGTLHLLPAQELPLYVAARNWHISPAWSNYFAEFGMTTVAQQESFLATIPYVLEQGPLSRQQLADAVAKHTGIARVRDFILSSSWGSPLKPSAYRGDLCFGPGQGTNVTFLDPKTYYGGPWQSIEPEQALKHMVQRYVRTYGPATPVDFARWWGETLTLSKKLFRSMSNELEEVEVEGWRAFALPETLEPMQSLEPAETVHLLPLFDTYTIGVPREHEPLLAQIHRSKVFRSQGWVSAVVLVNGSIQGVWQHTTKRTQTIVNVHLFSPAPPATSIRAGIEAEAQRLGAFFKTPVSVEFAEGLTRIPPRSGRTVAAQQ